MPSILFVCTGNQFRSPIAAACLSKSLTNEDTLEKWTIGSAGTWTESGMSAPGVTLRVARQLGLKGLERHRTRSISPKILEAADLIVVMEAGHKEAISIEFPAVRDRLYLLSEIVEGVAYDIPDPANPGIDPDAVGQGIHKLITQGKTKILQLAEAFSRRRT